MRATSTATVAALLLLANGVAAQPTPEPEPVPSPEARDAPAVPEPGELVRSGVELRRSGRNAEALELFSRAHALEPSPRTRAQIALAEQALGRWLEAETGLIAALQSQEDPWIDRNRGPLDDALSTVRRRLATLVVECNVVGAELWINGTPMGTLPTTGVRIVAGRTTIELRARGYEGARRSIDVAGGGGARERFTLVTLAARAAAAERADRGLPPVARPLGWASIGVGAVLIAGGVAAHVVRENNAARYNDDSQCFFGGQTRDQRCADERSAIDTARPLAIVGYAAGGVLAAGGVALIIATGRSARARTPAVACAAGPPGASCSGWF